MGNKTKNIITNNIIGNESMDNINSKTVKENVTMKSNNNVTVNQNNTTNNNMEGKTMKATNNNTMTNNNSVVNNKEAKEMINMTKEMGIEINFVNIKEVTKMTKAELINVAKEMGITVKSKDTKEVIMNKITEANIAAKKNDNVVNVKEENTMDSKKAKTRKFFIDLYNQANANARKGYGTSISEYMLCAIAVQTQFNIDRYNKTQKTKEMEEFETTIKDYLINNNYIKTATLRDKNRNVYYTDIYDGNFDFNRKENAVVKVKDANNNEYRVLNKRNLDLDSIKVSTYRVNLTAIKKYFGIK